MQQQLKRMRGEAAVGSSDSVVGSSKLQPRSNFATVLLNRWRIGELSAVDVQFLCHQAFLDGLHHHPEVAKLASLGNWGEVQGNGNRDLKKIFDSADLPSPSILRMPCLGPKGQGCVFAPRLDID